MAPAIIGVGRPPHIPPRLQLVDHGDQVARIDPDLLSQQALGRAHHLAQDHQHAELGERRPMGGERLREAPPRLGAGAGEQEAGAGQHAERLAPSWIMTIMKRRAAGAPLASGRRRR